MKEENSLRPVVSGTDYIITEYGIVSLMGNNSCQRDEALIDIAHPDFRKEL